MDSTLAAPSLDTLTDAFSAVALNGLSEAELRDRLDLAKQLEGLAAIGMARVVDRLSKAGAPRRDGASSLRGWVQQQTGRSTREAARLTRLAGGLDTLPATAAAVAAGDVTPESADVLLRAVDDGRLGDAEQIDSMFSTAVHLPADKLRGLVRQRTQTLDGAALRRDERRQHAMRRFALVDGPDGMTHVNGQLPSEVGERFRIVLDALDTPDPQDTPDEERRTAAQRTADALDELCRRTLANDGLPKTGGLVPQLTVHVDLATLETTFDDRDETEDQPPRWDDPRWADAPSGRTGFGQDLSAQTIRTLLCSASVTRIVTNGDSRPLDVGRATRTWSGSQRVAVNHRDRGCRGPGCDRPAAWTEIHHIVWWRNGGETNVHNALSLCHACHTLVHDDGWHPTLDQPTCDVTWTGPDGRTVIARSRPG